MRKKTAIFSKVISLVTVLAMVLSLAPFSLAYADETASGEWVLADFSSEEAVSAVTSTFASTTAATENVREGGSGMYAEFTVTAKKSQNLRFDYSGEDITAYNYLNMWVYSPKAQSSGIQLALYSAVKNVDGATANTYPQPLPGTNLCWEGWKLVSFDVSEMDFELKRLDINTNAWMASDSDYTGRFTGLWHNDGTFGIEKIWFSEAQPEGANATPDIVETDAIETGNEVVWVKDFNTAASVYTVTATGSSTSVEANTQNNNLYGMNLRLNWENAVRYNSALETPALQYHKGGTSAAWTSGNSAASFALFQAESADEKIKNLSSDATINFWMYNPQVKPNFNGEYPQIPIQIYTGSSADDYTTVSNSANYKTVGIIANWTGWKKVSIRLGDLTTTQGDDTGLGKGNIFDYGIHRIAVAINNTAGAPRETGFTDEELERGWRGGNGSGLTFNCWSDRYNFIDIDRVWIEDTNKTANKGLGFTADKMYYTQPPLASMPMTYEATVLLPEGYTSRGGVVFGNYQSGNVDCIDFEIYSNGNPRIYLIDNNLTVYTYLFDEVNVATGSWEHVAVTVDGANSELKCYVNGELKQTLSAEAPTSIILTNKALLAGDHRSGNGQYFKGRILNFGIYSDVRTAEEIASDYSGTLDTSDLMAYYDMSEYAGDDTPDVIEDLSGNDMILKLDNDWLIDVAEPENYAYSFAVVGDTQTITYYYPDKLTNIYDWLAENAFAKKLKFVFGLGDITEKNSDIEWSLAKAVIQKLDPVVPYSLIRGNHDSAVNFKRFFPYSEYADRMSGSYDGSMLNTYQKFKVGNIKYLVVNLDYGPSDAVLSWAGNVIAEHQDYNVIITTHAYLYRDGTTLDSGDACPPTTTGGYNDGDDIWDKLVSKYENIVLVLSGHDPCDDVVVTQTAGENGNIVTQMLVDPQYTDRDLGASGLVAMLYFSGDGKSVDVQYYSTVRDAYFKKTNQFSLELNVIEAQDADEETTITVDGVSFDVKLTSIGDSETVFVALYDESGRVAAIKQYPAAETVNVEFAPGESGKYVKIMVWTDKIMPICDAYTIMLP